MGFAWWDTEGQPGMRENALMNNDEDTDSQQKHISRSMGDLWSTRSPQTSDRTKMCWKRERLFFLGWKHLAPTGQSLLQKRVRIVELFSMTRKGPRWPAIFVVGTIGDWLTLSPENCRSENSKWWDWRNCWPLPTNDRSSKLPGRVARRSVFWFYPAGEEPSRGSGWRGEGGASTGRRQRPKWPASSSPEGKHLSFSCFNSSWTHWSHCLEHWGKNFGENWRFDLCVSCFCQRNGSSPCFMQITSGSGELRLPSVNQAHITALSGTKFAILSHKSVKSGMGLPGVKTLLDGIKNRSWQQQNCAYSLWRLHVHLLGAMKSALRFQVFRWINASSITKSSCCRECDFQSKTKQRATKEYNKAEHCSQQHMTTVFSQDTRIKSNSLHAGKSTQFVSLRTRTYLCCLCLDSRVSWSWTATDHGPSPRSQEPFSSTGSSRSCSRWRWGWWAGWCRSWGWPRWCKSCRTWATSSARCKGKNRCILWVGTSVWFVLPRWQKHQ